MGVIYFLVCVRRYKSNLPTNICLTVGMKTQYYREKWGILSETTLLPYFMTGWCVFFFTKVCVFLPMVFIRTFITTLCFCDFHHNIIFLWFLENSVGKKMHALPRCGLIFPFQMPYFLHWLFSRTLLTQLKPPEASEQAAKKVEGAGSALELPPGLTRPGPCEPKFWKNDLPAAAKLFLLCILKNSPKA